jgi:hypothetical protein
VNQLNSSLYSWRGESVITAIQESMNAKLRELDGSESIFDKSEVEARRVKVYG